MKHILLKRSDGGVDQMGLHARQFTRLSDGAEFLRAGATATVGEQMRFPIARTYVEKSSGGAPVLKQERLTLLVDLAGYDRGVAPDGWQFGYATVESQIAEFAPLTRDMIVSWREVPYDGIPWDLQRPRQTDKTFRSAWCDVTPEPKVDIDMPKARDVWRNRMRAARGPMMRVLDIEQKRALVARDEAKTAEIEARLQALRDVTADPAIEAAQTPAALKLIWPAVLTGTPA